MCRGHCRQHLHKARSAYLPERCKPWAMLTLAHPSLTGSANGSTGSGSTGWRGTFRSQLYLETPASEEGEPSDPDVRVLRRAKANYARRDETIELRWKEGVFVPLHAPTGILASIERRSAERVFLELLDKVISEGRYVSAANEILDRIERGPANSSCGILLENRRQPGRISSARCKGCSRRWPSAPVRKAMQGRHRRVDQERHDRDPRIP